MSSSQSATSSIFAPPPTSPEIDGGTGENGTLFLDETKLELGGGRATAPRMTLLQLQRIKNTLGDGKFEVGGAVGQGYKLDLNDEDGDDATLAEGAITKAQPTIALESLILDAGESVGGKITHSKTALHIGGGKATTSTLSMRALKKARLLFQVRQISIGIGGRAEGARLTIEEGAGTLEWIK